jgi:acetyl/propionyl-CoA carboxylase alpha subunit
VECEVEGPKSNIGFLERLARHPSVVAGTIDTGYLDRHLDEFMPREQVDGRHAARGRSHATIAAGKATACAGSSLIRSDIAMGHRRRLAARTCQQAITGLSCTAASASNSPHKAAAATIGSRRPSALRR